MANEISTEVNFGQEVTDKVRQLIMNAMPEEKLQAVLKAEYDSYFNTTRDRYSDKVESKFSKLVQSEISKFMDKKVQETVRAYLDTLVWGNGSEEAKTILATITPAVQEAMMKQTAFNVAQTYVLGLQNINNGRGY